MRRIFAATLVLIPVMATAQATTSTGTKPSPAATTLVAKATPPARPVAKDTDVPAAQHVAIHETVKPRVEALYLDDANNSTGTLGFTLINEPTDVAPQLVHIVETDIPDDMLNAPAVVSVRMTVDYTGHPQNITIEKSAGAAIDKKTLEAVSQYRFTPASVNHRPVESEVTVDIKVEKR